ncbi:hypothetical protein Cni_G29073 [Canna indica]|uniref:Transmembrane protein n=1 Tax=Canna indica TaxID=4628 RepID=A0AAQ3L473_9LILI|nr:hypothetical protein Cni_G29073 [Canna indica]
MERVVFLRLLLILLVFSHLLSFTAFPVPNEVAEAEVVEGRMEMEIEINDYPGSGANNRHTPRPVPARN